MATVYYTLEEVSKNNGTNDTEKWIIMKNNVYNVTPYLNLNEHPGGNELIEEWVGKDATKAFEDAGHSGDARSLLKQFKIGELAEEDRSKKSGKAKPAAPITSQKDLNSAPPAMYTERKEMGGRSCIAIITCGLMA